MGVSSAIIGTSIMLMFGLSLLGESLSVAMRVGTIGGGGNGGRSYGDIGGGYAPEDERPRER